MSVTVSWDQWRAYYDDWTLDDQRRFYDWVFAEHREQARFDAKTLGRLLAHAGQPVSVVELGGWDGEFAATMLGGPRPISSWTNYEISAAAVRGSVCVDPRYHAVTLEEWYWDGHHEADVFVASHVIEHIRLADLRATFDATDCRWMFLQAPLAEGPMSWQGYHGTHILEVGWQGVEEELERRGFELLDWLSRPMVRCYQRGPW